MYSPAVSIFHIEPPKAWYASDVWKITYSIGDHNSKDCLWCQPVSSFYRYHNGCTWLIRIVGIEFGN